MPHGYPVPPQLRHTHTHPSLSHTGCVRPWPELSPTLFHAVAKRLKCQVAKTHKLEKALRSGSLISGMFFLGPLAKRLSRESAAPGPGLGNLFSSSGPVP